MDAKTKISEAAATLGRLGGAVRSALSKERRQALMAAARAARAPGYQALGGVARANRLTPEQRSAIARKAGLAGGRGRKREKSS